MFLTKQEVLDLTGVHQKAAQRRWLRLNGFRYYTRADGSPVVPRSQVATGTAAGATEAAALGAAPVSGS